MHGRDWLVLAVLLLGVSTPTHAQTTPAWIEQYRDPAARLMGGAVSDTFAWRRLSVLTDSIVARKLQPSEASGDTCL